MKNRPGCTQVIVEHRANAIDRQALLTATSAGNAPYMPQSDLINRVVRKPWGFEYPIYVGRKSAIWLLHLMPSQMTSMHCHVRKTTALIVLDGSIRCKTLSGENERLAGQGVRLGMKTFHQSVAGPDGAVLMEVEAPVDKGDLVRLQDAYGRQQQGYEGLENTILMPSDLKTLTDVSEGEVHEHVIGRTKVSILSPCHSLNVVPSTNDLLCVLDGFAIDIEGYCFLEVGDLIETRRVGRRVHRWKHTSHIALISTTNSQISVEL